MSLIWWYTAFLSGIIYSNFCDSTALKAAAGIIAALAFISLIVKYRLRSLWSILLIIPIIGGMCYNTEYNKRIAEKYDFEETETDCMLRVTKASAVQNNYVSLEGVVYDINGREDLKAKARVLITGEDVEAYSYNDIIKIEKAIISGIKSENSATSFDFKKYCLGKKIYLSVMAENEGVSYVEHKGGLTDAFYNLRFYINETLGELFSDEPLMLMSGILTGDKSNNSDEFDNLMSGMGISHIVVVSGMHFSIIIAFLTLLLRKLRIEKPASALIIIAVSVLLALFFGMTPSILRASLVMIIYALCDIVLSDRHKGLHAVLLTLCGLIIYNPNMIYDLSLVLSYSAVIGIFLFNEKIGKPLSFLPRCISEVISLSISANILTFPIITYYFGRVTLMFIAGNMLVTPFVPFLMLAGAAAVLINLVSPGLTSFLTRYIQLGLNKLFGFLKLVESKTPTAIYVINPGKIWILVYYLTVQIILTVRIKAVKRPLAAVLAVYLAVSLFFDIPRYVSERSSIYKVDLYDELKYVGITQNGKAFFIDLSGKTASDKQIENNILSLINSKKTGGIDWYFVGGENQLSLLERMSEKIEIKSVVCHSRISHLINKKYKVYPLEDGELFFAEEFRLSVLSDIDYNIRAVEADIKDKRILMTKAVTDGIYDYDYILPSVYLKKKLESRSNVVFNSAGVSELDFYRDRVEVK